MAKKSIVGLQWPRKQIEQLDTDLLREMLKEMAEFLMGLEVDTPTCRMSLNACGDTKAWGIVALAIPKGSASSTNSSFHPIGRLVPSMAGALSNSAFRPTGIMFPVIEPEMFIAIYAISQRKTRSNAIRTWPLRQHFSSSNLINPGTLS